MSCCERRRTTTNSSKNTKQNEPLLELLSGQFQTLDEFLCKAILGSTFQVAGCFSMNAHRARSFSFNSPSLWEGWGGLEGALRLGFILWDKSTSLY